MTRDEILAMANEIGLRTIDEPCYLINFFHLAYAAGQRDMQERAAKMCETLEPRISSSATYECAAAIRKLGGEVMKSDFAYLLMGSPHPSPYITPPPTLEEKTKYAFSNRNKERVIRAKCNALRGFSPTEWRSSVDAAGKAGVSKQNMQKRIEDLFAYKLLERRIISTRRYLWRLTPNAVSYLREHEEQGS